MGGEGARPRIALVSAGDTGSRGASSGVYYFTARALEERCGEVAHLGPVGSPALRRGKLKRLAYRALTGKGYDYLHTLALARDYADRFGRALEGGRFDLVFAPEAATEIAFLRTGLPIVYLSDTTFALARDYYPLYRNLSASSVRQGDAVEAAAIGRAQALIYPTRWAARSAVEDYGAAPGKVHVVPLGANLEKAPARGEVLGRGEHDRCELLFVGVDWERKGGRIALETLEVLEGMGVDAHLTVCGCRPPAGISHPRLRVVPYLDKDDPAQAAELGGLYREADFLLFPSRAENSGFVLSEAAAFGLPVLAAATGGIPDMIEEGRNGFVLPLEAEGAEYAGKVREAWEDRSALARLRAMSRDAYEARLNWGSWADRVDGIIRSVLGGEVQR
jgi:glycosyltransferase involved in cell wall biosynthesis